MTKMKTKKCAKCGDEFHPFNRERTCSLACANLSKDELTAAKKKYPVDVTSNLKAALIRQGESPRLAKRLARLTSSSASLTSENACLGCGSASTENRKVCSDECQTDVTGLVPWYEERDTALYRCWIEPEEYERRLLEEKENEDG